MEVIQLLGTLALSSPSLSDGTQGFFSTPGEKPRPGMGCAKCVLLPELSRAVPLPARLDVS